MYNVIVFAGDGSGPEIIRETIRVLKVIEKYRPHLQFNFIHRLLGGVSIDTYGVPLTNEALEEAKSADAVLLGAVGGPKWDLKKVQPEAGLLQLRKGLGVFGNIRPCQFISDELVNLSPLKPEICRGTEFVIVRELTGGAYFGRKTEPDAHLSYAEDVEGYSRAEIERVTRLAAHLALQYDPPRQVTSLDKVNVMAATGRLWRQVVTHVMEREFPQLELHHQLIDSAAMLMVKAPRSLNGVVLTSNMFGDIISDEASVIPGSLGLLPSASLAATPDGKTKLNGIYEPIHGSAPDLAGRGLVNPLATILSGAMMVRYSMTAPEEASLIELAVKNVLDSGIRTADLGGKVGTAEMGDAVVAELEKLLS